MRLKMSLMKWASRVLLGPRIPTLVPSLEMVSKPPYRPKTYQATKPPISPRQLGHLSNNPTGRLQAPSKTTPSKTGRLKFPSRITRRKTIRRKVILRRTTRPRTIRLCFLPPKTAARCPQAMDTAKLKIQLIRPATIARRLPTLCRLGLDEHLHCFLAQSIAVCGGIDF